MSTPVLGLLLLVQMTNETCSTTSPNTRIRIIKLQGNSHLLERKTILGSFRDLMHGFFCGFISHLIGGYTIDMSKSNQIESLSKTFIGYLSFTRFQFYMQNCKIANHNTDKLQWKISLFQPNSSLLKQLLMTSRLEELFWRCKTFNTRED